jgi:hypothetical protein
LGGDGELSARLWLYGKPKECRSSTLPFCSHTILVMLYLKVGRANKCPPCQAPTVLAKRGLLSADGGPSHGALHLATAFPRPVWLDHLLPRLRLRETVMLRATCKAMPPIVADVRADLGPRPLKDLKAMLTCFPKADTVYLRQDEDHAMTPAEQDSLIAWLQERGHSLTHIQDGRSFGPFLLRAWRAGVFKTVKNVSLNLREEDQRDLIIVGVVSGVEYIGLELTDEVSPAERAAVGHLRHFPALKEIECEMGIRDAALPAFIPPSLEILGFECRFMGSEPVLLLGCLPPMIESSGAKLRRLELTFEELEGEDAACGLRSLFQACAPALKEVEFCVFNSIEVPPLVAEGLASCPHLERLTAPVGTFAMLPPGGGITFRLVHLWLNIDQIEGPVLSDFALWGLMARGGFPCLTSLRLEFFRWVWGGTLDPVIVPAFEGLAGTLKALTLIQEGIKHDGDGAEEDDEMRQLGKAIAKLRRLETLHLSIGIDGVVYHRIAQGMGEGACPALRSLTCFIASGAAWLACQPSIILPSVRALRASVGGVESGAEPLALACALAALGYRGSVVMGSIWQPELRDQIRALLQPRAHVRFEI